MSRASLTSK